MSPNKPVKLICNSSVFLYTDNGGIIRGKSTHINALENRINDGIGLTLAMQAMNMMDQLASVEGMGPVGEIRMVPDPNTFRVLPYAPRVGAMTVDMIKLDGTPWEACPRFLPQAPDSSGG